MSLPRYRISVSVRPEYLPEQSAPDEPRYVFAYHITIRNEGTLAARLQTRHWIITDAWGRSEEIHGDGVVGETPRLEPGEHYEYTSHCPLTAPFGRMRGSYGFLADDGMQFEAEIPEFALVGPRTLH